MVFFFQAEDGIRDLVRSRGLGDVYKRQDENGERPEQGGGAPDRRVRETENADHRESQVVELSLIHI